MPSDCSASFGYPKNRGEGPTSPPDDQPEATAVGRRVFACASAVLASECELATVATSLLFDARCLVLVSLSRTGISARCEYLNMGGLAVARVNVLSFSS